MELTAPIFAFLISVGVCYLMQRTALHKFFLDIPVDRSLHVAPVPRIGGLGIVMGVLSAALVGRFSGIGPWVGLACALAAVSLLDDWRGLTPLTRLMSQFAAATLFVLWMLHFDRPLVAIAAVVATVWITNLYNFMDGADGLAGGMAFFGFGTYSICACWNGDDSVALFSLAVAMASLGFLFFNFPPAKMFMGDVGSIPLGFLASATGLYGHQRGLWPIWFPIIVFLPFVSDATVTLARRALKGEPIWLAHRAHYYQRQVLMGWTHKRLAVAEYSLMIASGSIALVATRTSGIWPVLLIGCLGTSVCALMVGIDHKWARRRPKNA